MKITVDMQACQTEGSANRGIGRYSMALACAMQQQIQSEDSISYMLNDNYTDSIVEIKKQLPDSRIDYYRYPIPNMLYGTADDFMRPIAEDLILQKYNKTEPDIIYISSIFEGFGGKAVVPNRRYLSRNIVVAATLYDLIPLVMPDIYLCDSYTKKWYYDCLEKVKSCDILLAISEATRQDAIKYLGISPDKVVNILGAVDDMFQVAEIENKDQLLKTYGINKSFLMYTGGIDYRKNIEGLIKAYALVDINLRNEIQLVIVCSVKQPEKVHLLEIASDAGLKDNEVIFTGFVPDEHLVKLYNLCDLFIFPSKYEGFGLPVIEAMKCGAPVIGANNSSISEIIANDEALFNADDINDIAKKIDRGFKDLNFRTQLCEWSKKRSKDFSWEKSAQIAIASLKEAMKIKHKDIDHVSYKFPYYKKIAYMTPLPPEKSGIAAYSNELLPELGEYFDIDIFTDAEKCTDLSLTSRFNIYSFKEFDGRVNDYEMIVYQMGNSAFHTYMYEFLMRYPGIVVQHDFFLSGLINYIACTTNNEQNPFFSALLYSHGLKGVSYFQTEGTEATILKYPMNKKVLDSAQGVIFHSQYALKLYKQFYGSTQFSSIACINHMREKCKTVSEDERMTIRHKLKIADNELVIASFGFLSETKLNHLLIEAYIQLCKTITRQNNNIKLIFVGELGQSGYKTSIDNLIKQNDSEDIIVTGFVSDVQYQNYMIAADAAVQLRCKSRGETSGAVLDCLANGLPTIVNRYATFNDYPDNVVMKIPQNPSIEDIIEALNILISDKNARRLYAANGRKYIAKEHDIKIIAKQYADFINKIIYKNINDNKNFFIKKAARIIAGHDYNKNDLLNIAQAYEKNNSVYHIRRVLGIMEKSTWHTLLNVRDERYKQSVTIECANVILDKDSMPFVTDIAGNNVAVPTHYNDVLITSINNLNSKTIELVKTSYMNLYVLVQSLPEVSKIDPKIYKYVLGIIVQNNITTQSRKDNAIVYNINAFWEYIYKLNKKQVED